MFGARATAAGASLATGRMVSKISSEVLATKLDGFGIEASDACKVSDGGCIGLVCERGSIPATLRLTHAREQEVDLMVVVSKLRVGPSLAGVTCAVMDHWFRLFCHLGPFPGRGRVYQVLELILL